MSTRTVSLGEQVGLCSIEERESTDTLQMDEENPTKRRRISNNADVRSPQIHDHHVTSQQEHTTSVESSTSSAGHLDFSLTLTKKPSREQAPESMIPLKSVSDSNNLPSPAIQHSTMTLSSQELNPLRDPLEVAVTQMYQYEEMLENRALFGAHLSAVQQGHYLSTRP